MRLTANRKHVLAALADSGGDCGDPPHSAADVAWVLRNAHNYQWDGFELKTVPSKQQIHRTLKELWCEGLIVASRYKEDRWQNLPGWVIKYEAAEGMFERVLESRIAALHRRVVRALNGITVAMFGSKPFDQGATPKAAEAMRAELDTLLARSDDPRLHECLAALEAGLPLPDGFLPKTAKGLRSVMQQHHPDKGGNRAVFEQAKAALDALRQAA
jgi:hypothetical protein